MERLQLHEKLKELLGSDNVYFQPPPSLILKFPCIVYSLQSYNNKYADNGIYNTRKRYKVTVIDEDPDSDIPDKLNEFTMSYFDRWYAADGLNHYVFNLYL